MANITKLTTGVRTRVRRLSSLGWLLTANISVFVVLRLLAASNIFTGSRAVEQSALAAVELPASLTQLLLRPWTPLTYMFAHFDMFHAVFNVLWLWWFGQIFLEMSSQRRLIWLYIAGGLAGAAAFVTGANMFVGIGATGCLIGSSAAVLAIVTATAVMQPDRRVGLVWLGSIRLKWIAIVMIAISMVSLGMDSPGSHIAHLGGALAGLVGAVLMRRQGRREAIRLLQAGEPDTVSLDRLLDKIRRSGYSSLTSEERAALFDISTRIRR